jgi:hypothetical protein
MGDKSPKQKARQQKQDSTSKTQKQAAAYTKAHPNPAEFNLGKKAK